MKSRIKFTNLFRHKMVAVVIIGAAVVTGLLVYRLGTLTPGLSAIEGNRYPYAMGWHGLYVYPFDFQINLLHVLGFKIDNHYGALLLRLPSIIYGLMATGLFALLIKHWHGTRTTLLATALFACNAWFLHVSRLAANDILYLWAILLLLVVQLFMLKLSSRSAVWYLSLLLCGSVLYIPGMVWFVLLSLWWQRAGIINGWRAHGLLWQRTIYVLCGIVWLPLLIYRLNSIHQLIIWLGLPSVFNLAIIGRQLLFVPVHILVRGPFDPQRWLGHAPLLDVFTLALTLAGIWFYIRHFKATRTRVLFSYSLVGFILVGLGGSVPLSVLVPLALIFSATGIAYLLHQWLTVFPNNPFARRIGIGLVTLGVVVSCSYNLRAYFVAWPHNPATRSAYTSLSTDR